MAKVYQLLITLRESDPLIWRRFLAPATVRLPRFHNILQAVMGWENYHLHQFMHAGTVYGMPDPEFPLLPRFEDEANIPLSRLLTDPGDSVAYEYDLGDSWWHDIVLEAVLSSEPKAAYPWCLSGAGACPPEDAGGIDGFYQYLAAIGDPSHEEHEQVINWRPGYDPTLFNLAAVNTRLKPRSRQAGASPA